MYYYIIERGPYSKTIEYLTKAAIQGCAVSQDRLGWMHMNSIGFIGNDYKKAMEYLKLSAEQGFCRGQNNLGWMYSNGFGVPSDYHKALQLYRKSAEKGFDAAQCNIGHAYHNGLGVMLDYKKAIEWYGKAAVQGDYMAIKSLRELLKETKYTVEEYMKLDNEIVLLRSEKTIRKHLIDALTDITMSYL